MGRPKGSKNKGKTPASTPAPQRSFTPLLSIEDEIPSSQATPMPPSTQPEPSQSSKRKNLPDFDRDGPPSSQELILRYFEEDPNNIKRFYGGISGKSTIVMAGEVSRYILDNGGQYERTASSIHLKVNSWKRQWHEARDYMDQTGAGGGARKLADAEEIGDEEYNKALQEVECDKLSKCPLFERLDPIFWETGGGDPSLYGDSAQDSNPTLNSLEKGLDPSRTPLQQSNPSSSSVPATPTPRPLSQPVQNASRTAVRSSNWNNFGDDSQSDISCEWSINDVFLLSCSATSLTTVDSPYSPP
ncbi:hypothetical protein L486_06000 [Kwoniella mangroviensis CBS 10435]|uniref:Uncharacterized protein n=1 Tax=Kwoniella mangroviensis CBS 10435 TaxID=1331196 RepID=A0A1B9INV7_9TREE|nr:hypothetical protein L486_06000 [Kwoniella mangroviensis CBS 10435]